jgi:glutaredoxin 2
MNKEKVSITMTLKDYEELTDKIKEQTQNLDNLIKKINMYCSEIQIDKIFKKLRKD